MRRLRSSPQRRPPEPPQAPQAEGRIDEPALGSTATRGALTVRGWALFPSGPTARVEIWLGEKSLGLAQLGIPRPDLRAVSDLPDAGIAGFSLVADVTCWPGSDGEVAVRATASSATGETLELEPATVNLASAPQRTRRSTRPPAPATRGDGLRTLVCTHQLCLGGASRYLLELLRELRRREKIDPIVLSPFGGPLRAELEGLGIPVHVSGPAPLEDPEARDGRLEELLAWAAPQRFEIAFVNTASPYVLAGAELAGQLGIPATWAIHESFEPAVLWADCDVEVRGRAADTLAAAAHAVFEADATRRIYEPYLPGRCITVPYGLDLGPIDALREGFDRTATRRRLGIPEDADVLICSGTIEPRKAQAQLAQAFDLIAARHPRALLVLAGATSGLDSVALAEWVASSNSAGRIRLVETTPEIQSWHGAADILVCASRIESLPRVALEAMAWEMPILATSVFGLPELIEDGETGWLCEPGDTRLLADALDRALRSSPAERRRIGRAARALVERRHAIGPYTEEVGRLLAGARGATR
jgi:D-inositol-3-phosphate glycosyltransferase